MKIDVNRYKMEINFTIKILNQKHWMRKQRHTILSLQITGNHVTDTESKKTEYLQVLAKHHKPQTSYRVLSILKNKRGQKPKTYHSKARDTEDSSNVLNGNHSTESDR